MKRRAAFVPAEIKLNKQLPASGANQFTTNLDPSSHSLLSPVGWGVRAAKWTMTMRTSTARPLPSRHLPPPPLPGVARSKTEADPDAAWPTASSSSPQQRRRRRHRAARAWALARCKCGACCPRGVVRRRRRRRWRRQAGVARVVEASGVQRERVAVAVAHGHGRLEARPLRELALLLVRVLVPAQRLRRPEVPAAVAALEPPAAPCAAAAVADCARTRRHLDSRLRGCGGGIFGGAGFFGDGGGDDDRGSAPRDVEPEQPDGRRWVGGGRRRFVAAGEADEWKLRERVDARGRSGIG